jgi:hypothetical protein
MMLTHWLRLLHDRWLADVNSRWIIRVKVSELLGEGRTLDIIDKILRDLAALIASDLT